MAKPNISYHNVRLNLDNEQHCRVNKVLAELNKEIHKSVNQSEDMRKTVHPILTS